MQLMQPEHFKDPAWFRALPLTERLSPIGTARPADQIRNLDNDGATRRIQAWRLQPPFNEAAHFTKRLAVDGIIEEDLLQLLGEPIEALRDRCKKRPEWLEQLERAFSPGRCSAPFATPENGHSLQTVPFMSVIEPLLGAACGRLYMGIQRLAQAHPDAPFDPKGAAAILTASSLPRQLPSMLARTLVLELNVARLRGLLTGKTPSDRFQSFLERLRQRDIVLTLLQEYPVLARQLILELDHWVSSSLEFLEHLCADWDGIRSLFGYENDPGTLAQVTPQGDPHCRGKHVLIVDFSSGLRLVYKPRPMALDVHFQQLLEWINARGGHPLFRTLTILDCGRHGWVEFVHPQECRTEPEVRRFYQRQGGYLALLYALEAADFHCENLIAAGEQPVLVDLETLFHPRTAVIDARRADQMANDALYYSVCKVGLLPDRIFVSQESEGVDMSGLGSINGQLTPFPVPQWEEEGSDVMRLIRRPVAMPASGNRPTLNGAELNVLDYADAIVAGFSQIYRLILQHRNELLQPECGPLPRFAQDEVRVIFRPTQSYGTLLQESFHPDLLRDALERDRLFDGLWMNVPALPLLSNLIPAERHDLLNGDIPRFTTRPESRDIWTSLNQRLPGLLPESGMTLVRRRLERLSDADLERQTWLTRASLAMLSTNTTPAPGSSDPPIHLRTSLDRADFLAASRAACDRLASLAFRSENDACWLGLTSLADDHWSLNPLGTDLYDGLPGVAMFLAYLGDITREERYTALAQAALTTLRSQVEESKALSTSIGAFSGWGGVIYTLAHLSVLWGEQAMLAEAEALVDLLPPLIEQDECLDIISGSAGCIGSLLSLYRCAPTGATLAAAIQCGDRLIACARPTKHGVGWIAKAGGTQPLTGFSHGAAGIAWALLELAALTGEERFRRTALDGICYERSVFSPEARNWPDLRELKTSREAVNGTQQSFATAWCHGAPGIGLARLRSLPYLDDGEVREEIQTAMTTTLAQAFGGNHSLCHGELGNLELLIQASESLDDPQWSGHVNRIASTIVESIGEKGWLCGNPLAIESPGLMTGVAGIGYGLLRLAEPGRVPSVLVLAPPNGRAVR